MIFADPLAHSRRQTAGLRTEHQRIARAVFEIRVATAASRLDRHDARIAERLETRLHAGVDFDFRKIVVVEPGTLQALVVQAKAQRLDQMQRGSRVGAESDDVSGVGDRKSVV